jgi:3-oxoacid CoA-transferase subunit B
MEHCSKSGESKVLRACTLPLTGRGCVDLVVTDLCVFDMDRHGGGMRLVELAPGVSLQEVQAKTQAEFRLGDLG